MSDVKERNIALHEERDQGDDGAPLRFDPARYRAELDQFDIGEEQAQALLATLWSIMQSFVELGFTPDVSSLLVDKDTIPERNQIG